MAWTAYGFKPPERQKLRLSGDGQRLYLLGFAGFITLALGSLLVLENDIHRVRGLLRFHRCGRFGNLRSVRRRAARINVWRNSGDLLSLLTFVRDLLFEH